MKNTPPVKNTDPKTLDLSNVGDCVVIKLSDGVQRSALMTFLTHDGARAHFSWRTGPGRYDVQSTTIDRSKWGRFVLAIFPAGCKFLAV
jgi:hypothetical protein